MKNKTVVTITGIRPDFIRMSKIFEKLDENFNHILIHSGQHYDKLLSDVFFDELAIRRPDYNLCIGREGREHFEQTADLSVSIIKLLRTQNIQPDIILFLGDSNSVCCAVQLKKEGYRIGHIEAGMRSYDRRMLEEINRVVCDHCSDMLFVYHEDYKKQAIAEGIPAENIFVVGNTIVEVASPIAEELKKKDKEAEFILADIHRPENFKYSARLQNIFDYLGFMTKFWCMPVKMLSFPRTIKAIEEFNIDMRDIELIPLMSYKDFMQAQYDCMFLVSDSGTAQEEAALLDTPVIVPRDFTERPQSITYKCSMMLDVMNDGSAYPQQEEYTERYGQFKVKVKNGWTGRVGYWRESLHWLADVSLGKKINPSWLGDGTTSDQIIKILNERL